MVVFTCLHCGEPVKKPAVSKHYDTRCYGRNPNLTCVDCLKDFRGSEYEVHTKCISENERYGAKGSFTGNTVNKGEKKQQEWAEHIQNILQTATFKADERQLLDTISKHENIPRQKKKFENFLNNAYKSYRFSSDLVNRVWEKIKLPESTNPISSNQPPGKENSFKSEDNVLECQESKKRKHDEALSELAAGDSNAVSDVPKAKKNKKSKKDKSEDVAELEEEEEKGAELNDDESNKKKKKKKKRENGEEDIQDMIVENGGESGSHKKKDKKKKQEIGEGDTHKIVENGAESVTNKKKDKKKSQKPSQENSEENVEEMIVENGAELESNKKNSKKSKNKTLEDAEQETPNNESSADKKKKKKDKKEKHLNGEILESTQEIINGENKGDSNIDFCWKTAIQKVLAKKDDGEKILLKALEKKVLKKYSKATGKEIAPKKLKKFTNRLKKVPNITIKDEYVIVHKMET